MSAFLRLMRVEFSRLLHRRAVLVLVALCLAAPVLIGVGVTIDTRPPAGETVAEAERQLEAALADPTYQRGIKECIAEPDAWGLDSGLDAAEIKEQCRDQNEPQLEWYLWTSILDLEQEQNGSALAVAMVLALAMLVAGTTFIGHDWASGSVSNQLLFEPRRARVWWAKALVVSLGGFALGAILMTAYWLALNAVAASRDLPSGGTLLLDGLQMGWRAAVFAGAAALVGFALTMLFRSTVATVGVVFGIALLGTLILGVLGVDGRWNPAINAAAFVTGEATYYVEVPCPPGQDEFEGYCSDNVTITAAQGGGYLGGAVAAASAASLLWFRRRDVP